MKINNIQKDHKLQVENNLEAKKIFLKENNEIAKINGRGVKACETVGMIGGSLRWFLHGTKHDNRLHCHIF